jgi:hypothetical protein
MALRAAAIHRGAAPRPSHDGAWRDLRYREFGLAVPGHASEMWFKIFADLAGTTFSGWCGELCAAGHADMRAVPLNELASAAEDQRIAIRRASEDLAAQHERREGEAGQ